MNVDGISVAAALAIKNGSIVNGYINNTTGHLILVTGGGTEIDSGIVVPAATIVNATVDGSGNLVFTRKDGSTFIAANIMGKTVVPFTASGTFTKATYPGMTKILMEFWGGGSGSNQGGSLGEGCGGAGGGYFRAEINAADVPATIPIVVGAGGAASSGVTGSYTNPSGAGGNSTATVNGKVIGAGGGGPSQTSTSSAVVYGGGGGGSNGDGTPDVGKAAAGSPSAPSGSGQGGGMGGGVPNGGLVTSPFGGGTGGYIGAYLKAVGGYWGGGGGGNSGGDSVYGGAGGSGAPSGVGGQSMYGGDGGTGPATSASAGTPGSIPGGGAGGGGKTGAGAAGGRGEVRITVFYT